MNFAGKATASLALVAGLFAGCADDAREPNQTNPEAEVVEAIERALQRRARALAAEDPTAFARTIAQRDKDFARSQRRYFDNLRQLPLGKVRFELDPETLRPRGRQYWAEVRITLEVRGYDAAPVETRDRWRFRPVDDGRRFVLSSVTDPAWEGRFGSQVQPWDLLEVNVLEENGVLIVFDRGTAASAERILEMVANGRSEVAEVLPDSYEDRRGVVVYTLSDPAFVESLEGLPVNDPDRLDGLTIPVLRRSIDGKGAVASYRILLDPDVLDEGEQVLDRLVRHELTHVALGDRARGVPLWLTEGLAEYVSVRPLAPVERRLQSEALDLAAAGIDGLPPDGVFGGPSAEGWYGVSWWICEFVAGTYGADALWSLLSAFDRRVTADDVLAEELQISGEDLVQGGVSLMRRTYG